MFCRAQIVDLAKHRDELRTRGVQVIIIGPATADDAAWLTRRMHVPFPVLADDTGEVFAAFGLSEGDRRQLAGPRVMARAIQALLHGWFPGGSRGRGKQLPGMVLVDRAGRIRMRQAGEDAGDHLTARELLRAVDKVAPLERAQPATT